MAASIPNIFAAKASNSFTVGSSKKTSSPTSADSIASSISGVGFVTVSLLKSIVDFIDCESTEKLRKWVDEIIKSGFSDKSS